MADIVNIVIDQGSTFTYVLTVTNLTGTPINLSNYSARGMIRKTRKATDKILDLPCQITNVDTGEVTVNLTAAQTAAIIAGEKKNDPASKYWYDIEIYLIAGGQEMVYRIVEGTLQMNQEVTR